MSCSGSYDPIATEDLKMKILVLNGSPKGENSITLQTVRYLEQFLKTTEIEVLHVGQRIRHYEKDFSEAAEALRKADLILFVYPVYTFLVPSQLHRFLELVREHRIDLTGRYASQLSTSMHFYDTTAHRFIQDTCDDLGMHYIHGLSAGMDDLLKKQGQEEARAFFRYLLWNVRHGFHEPARYPQTGPAPVRKDIPLPAAQLLPDSIRAKGCRIALIADLTRDDTALAEMILSFRESIPFPCELVNIREFSFSGGCLGCFRCASDGTCVYNDRFDDFLRGIQKADAIVYAYTVRDHSMGSRFKMFDDRQFCNGHRTVTMGKPVGYLVSGSLREEENLRILMESRAQVGGNYLAGIASDDSQGEQGIRQLAERLSYCLDHRYSQPKNFYGVGGLKIFRDLIYQMQGLMREDHRFYREHGFYDFPQKKKGTIAAMYLVGAMMKNPRLQKKLGGRMTEGMLMPYRKLIEKEKARRKPQS